MNQMTIQHIVFMIIPLIFAITVHEVAHGWVANKLGDPTARMLGRLTLNPIKHIDPIGTILVPAVLLFLGGFIFGWAKPVPVTYENLKHPKRDMALVALAGPGANLVMALIWALIAKIGIGLPNSMQSIGYALAYMGLFGVMINLVLLVLNLIPIPPLDGSRVVSAFLHGKSWYYYNMIAPYGFWILLALLVTGILSRVMMPIINLCQAFILAFFGIH